VLTSPEKFAAQINDMFAGEIRYISAADIIDMTKCGLIGCYQYYNLRSDGERIRGVLQYEKLREGRLLKIARQSKVVKLKCKSCRKSLPAELARKVGRPKEYCPSCESFRNTERYRKWRKRKRQLENKSLAGSA